MTLAAIPFTTLRLVPHAGGGAILRNHAGYIAGTMIDPSIVAAFSTASSVLASLGSGAALIATSPAVLGGVAIATVAAGTYCYFYGLPPLVIESLAHAGLGAAKKSGFAVAAPKLAVALVLLGAAGYLSYEFYKSLREVRARPVLASFHHEPDGRLASEIAFGPNVWQHFGTALWSNAQQASIQAAKMAQEAVASAKRASHATGKSALAATTLLSRLLQFVRTILTKYFRVRL